MRVAVCIPFRATSASWVQNLVCVRRPFDDFGWPVYLGDNDDETFSRGRAINAAARIAIDDWNPDVLLVTDACLYAPDIWPLRQATTTAHARDCYVVAFSRMHVLDEPGTDAAREGVARNFWSEAEPVVAMIWGGLFAISSLLWERTCGFDERFIGYGSEDLGFLPVANTLGRSEKQRVNGDVFHLAHPTNEARDHYADNARLASRYRGADGDPDAIRAILRERECNESNAEEE